MNQIKLLKLIKGVRQFEGFDMGNHRTCICAVGRKVANATEDVWFSHDLARWLEWPEGLALDATGRSLAQARLCAKLACAKPDATKEEAIDTLKYLGATGKVEWDPAQRTPV